MATRELYFDIHADTSGGSLYRLQEPDGTYTFLYEHSTYDEDRDETSVFHTAYATFEAFWEELTKDREWFYRHPLFVHPEQRDFVQAQLSGVDWTIQDNPKWQASHQRQWTKVLTDPASYYRGPGGKE
ncbi:MAG TPA: hypothetical protein VHK69_10755 [Chitinophagaceae bacterium]|jgi:hypothetical protein|nr:hypothetical protein [Chitinophagaceae bacterium]